MYPLHFLYYTPRVVTTGIWGLLAVVTGVSPLLPPTSDLSSPTLGVPAYREMSIPRFLISNTPALSGVALTLDDTHQGRGEA